MDRIPSFDKIGVTPVPDWQNAAPSAGIAGSIFNVEAINALQHELVNAIVGSGLTADATNYSQLLAAIKLLAAAAAQSAIPSYSALEGVKDVNGVFSLDVPGLTEEDTLSATDLISFYQMVAEGGQVAGHHRKTTTAALASYIISFLSSITTSNPLPNIVQTQGLINVYSRVVFNQAYILTEGAVLMSFNGEAYKDFTLPVAFPDEKFTCLMQDTNNTASPGPGVMITGLPVNGGTIRVFARVAATGANYVGNLNLKYIAVGHAVAS